MDDDQRWWDLIERARDEAGNDFDDRAALLSEWLSEQKVTDIQAFDRFVQERIRDAYRSDLWAVAYLMNGGCSDDGFDYFLAWLISEGKQRYYAALEHPEAAAENVDPGDEPFECPDLWSVAAQAWAEKTGRDSADWYDKHAADVPRQLIGELFDEDHVAQRYPEIAARFS